MTNIENLSEQEERVRDFVRAAFVGKNMEVDVEDGVVRVYLVLTVVSHLARDGLEVALPLLRRLDLVAEVGEELLLPLYYRADDEGRMRDQHEFLSELYDFAGAYDVMAPLRAEE